jgi:hypothetical protein
MDCSSEMTEIKHTARRYLLGELTEAEQSALEETYFNDAQVFAEVAAEENALVDDYVRGRLAPETRHRFETVYLSRPERRARVEFAEALLTRADASPASSSGDRSGSRRAGWLTAWLSPRPALAAAAVAAGIVIGIALWTAQQSSRPGPESQQARTSNGSPSTPSTTPPGPPVSPTLSVVTLAMTVGAGQRSSSPSAPTTLEIPANTDTVRLALTLRERDYGRYRVIVRAIGAEEVLRRDELKPSLEPSAPAFTIDVPAATFASGDYMLTLQGATGTGEFDDLSQSLFRVVKR